MIVCCCLILQENAQPVQFENVREFKSFAAAKGLFTHTGLLC